MRPANAPLTISVIVICWIVFALDHVLDSRGGAFGPLMVLGAIIPSEVQAGQWWRIFTAGFLHFNLAHIFFNSYALLQAGSFVEFAFGTARYSVIYFGALIVGGIAAYWSTLGTPETLTAGASGAIMGVFGAMAVLAFKLPALRGALLRSALLPIILTLGYGFTNPYISNAGHIGGVLAGALLALPLQPRIAAPLPPAAAEEEPEIIPPRDRW